MYCIPGIPIKRGNFWEVKGEYKMEFYCWYFIIFCVSYVRLSSSEERYENRTILLLQPTTSIWLFKPLNINTLNAELNPICHLLALLGGATIVVVNRLRVKIYTRQNNLWTAKWAQRGIFCITRDQSGTCKNGVTWKNETRTPEIFSQTTWSTQTVEIHPCSSTLRTLYSIFLNLIWILFTVSEG